MKIGVFITALLFYMAPFASSVELPKPLVEGLESEDFKKREASQRELTEWAKAEKKSPAPALYHLFKTSEEPETRKRCYDILKNLSDQDYLSDGQGFIGITMQHDIIDLPGKDKPLAAITITNVVKNSPAEKFGLQVGDAITTLDGKGFENEDVLNEFKGLISAKKPMDEVLLGVKRANGEIDKIKVVLSRNPGANINVFPQNLHLMDERAREQHFEIWLEKLAKETDE